MINEEGLIWCCSKQGSQHQNACKIAVSFSITSIFYIINQLTSLSVSVFHTVIPKESTSPQYQTVTTKLSYLSTHTEVYGLMTQRSSGRMSIKAEKGMEARMYVCSNFKLLNCLNSVIIFSSISIILFFPLVFCSNQIWTKNNCLNLRSDG